MIKSRTTSPDAAVFFYAWDELETRIGQPFDWQMLEAKQFEARQDIINVTTSKTKGSPGTWSVTLSPRINWLQVIHVGMWAMIYLSDQNLETRTGIGDGGAQDTGLKMVGQIRSIRVVENTDPVSGARTVRFQVSGDDFQRILNEKLYINRYLTPANDAQATLTRNQFYYGDILTIEASPDIVVGNLIKVGLNSIKPEDAISNDGGRSGGVYGVPGAVISRLMDTDSGVASGFHFIKQHLMPNLLGKTYPMADLGNFIELWSTIQSYSNPILNEIYTDLLPKKIKGSIRLVPSLILRPIPFTEKPPTKGADGKIAPFYRIRDSKPNPFGDAYGFYTSRIVSDDEIFSFNYGRGDGERFNFFFVLSNVNGAAKGAVDYQGLVDALKAQGEDNPSLGFGNQGSIVRHGLRPYTTNTNYITTTEEMVQLNEMVRDMWHRATLYDTGQVQLIGIHNHIPVGTNIEFKNRDWIGHVEGVNNAFNVAPNGSKSYRTAVTLVRIQRKSGEPLCLARDGSEGYGNAHLPRNIDPGITTLRAYTSELQDQSEGKPKSKKHPKKRKK